TMIRLKVLLSEFVPVRDGILQRKSACSGAPSLNGECEECYQKQLTIKRQAVQHGEPDKAPLILHDVLRSKGQPLDAAPRTFFEPRFGHDFSQVRVHTDARAAESARAVNALAYTVGHNVVFGSGQYSPGSEAGKHLLAHELTHVIQQGNKSSSTTTNLALGDKMDVYEHEADRRAASMVDGKQLNGHLPISQTGVAIQRQPQDAGQSPASAPPAAVGWSTDLLTIVLYSDRTDCGGMANPKGMSAYSS